MSRMKTGLVRPYPVPVNLDGDEDELLAREAFDQRKSKAELLRNAYFQGSTRVLLLRLRDKQKHLPMSKFRRAPMEREADVRA